MAISSGFYNSVNGDRTYDADQFGSLFDGIIAPGVFPNVGDKFRVRPTKQRYVCICGCWQGVAE